MTAPRRNPQRNPARPPAPPPDTFGGRFIEAIERVGPEQIETRVYRNATYEVHAREIDYFGAPGVTHLAVRRHDGAVVEDWRHMQRVKNALAGPEREAIELYPAESRLVDTANSRSLWVMPAGHVVAVGWTRRQIFDGGRWGLCAQRPFPAGQRPDDAAPFQESYRERAEVTRAARRSGGGGR